MSYSFPSVSYGALSRGHREGLTDRSRYQGRNGPVVGNTKTETELPGPKTQDLYGEGKE